MRTLLTAILTCFISIASIAQDNTTIKLIPNWKKGEIHNLQNVKLLLNTMEYSHELGGVSAGKKSKSTKMVKKSIVPYRLATSFCFELFKNILINKDSTSLSLEDMRQSIKEARQSSFEHFFRFVDDVRELSDQDLELGAIKVVVDKIEKFLEDHNNSLNLINNTKIQCIQRNSFKEAVKIKIENENDFIDCEKWVQSIEFELLKNEEESSLELLLNHPALKIDHLNRISLILMSLKHLSFLMIEFTNQSLNPLFVSLFIQTLSKKQLKLLNFRFNKYFYENINQRKQFRKSRKCGFKSTNWHSHTISPALL